MKTVGRPKAIGLLCSLLLCRGFVAAQALERLVGEAAKSFHGARLAPPPRPEMAGKAKARLEASLLVDGRVGASVRPRQPAVLTMAIVDPETGQAPEFEPVHEKLMHLILVSRDLETFSHLHPALIGQTSAARFELEINRGNSDPDNAGADQAVPKPGRFFVFAEAKPKGRPALPLRFDLVSEGEERVVPLMPDPALPSGEIRKFFNESSGPGREGDKYRATLKIERDNARLHLRVVLDEFVDHSGHRMYSGVRDLEPWLGALGHGVLIGDSGDGAEQRVFHHLHGSSGGDDGDHGEHAAGAGGPELLFLLHGDDVPPAGLFKVWIQTRHRGRIMTLPFVIRL